MFTLGELAQRLGLAIEGDEARSIVGLAALAEAGPDQISFLSSSRHQHQLKNTRAGAVIITDELRGHFEGDALVSENPYLSFAQASALFDARPHWETGLHPSAVIDPTCTIGQDVTIGANCVVGMNVVIGDGVNIGPGCSIGANSHIGKRSRLHARVTVYDGVIMGDDCNLHSGVVIGADGFGYARDEAAWVRIHQLGGVRLGHRVEVGANSCIDRGALGDTVVEDGVIIDNLVQIGHNVRLGSNTAIAACAAIAGSAVIGKNCTIAGATGITGHIEVADGVHITAMSLVTNSITEAGSYSSGTRMGPTTEWRKNAVRFSQLNEMHKRIRALEEAQD